MSSSNLLFIIILAFHMAKHIPYIETTKIPSLSLIGTTGVPQKHTNNINRDNDNVNDGDDEKCGGYLTNQYGVIGTPKFPNKFRVPITCTWIIDGSMIVTPNLTINIYLTQLYVLAGLKFTEYMYYSDDYKVPSHNVIELSEDNVTQIALIQFTSPYLEIKFHMANLHGTHLRVLDRFLNVYGFNITYEIGTGAKEVQCNTKRCSFLGHCYVDRNFTSYRCGCFTGFNGNDCGIGPLCKDKKRLNYCENGGTCKHIGNSAITCLCPPGYKGNKCNILVHEDLSNIGCTIENSESCSKQCSSTGGDENICECTSNIVSATTLSSSRGKVRYEATIKLGNSLHYNTTVIDGKDDGGANMVRFTETVSSSLEKHISRFLRNFNITKINDLEVFTKTPSSSDISFQFFGAKNDGIRVREAVNRMVERGRLGNFSLVPTYLVFRQEPGLMLQSVVLNQRSAVREGSEFILSCVAQGSSKMVFRWYKNGYYVNISRATRNMWTRLLPLDLKDHYTAVLGISKATKLDEGIYTCQVLDFGMQQCQSTRVNILGIPQLQVYPSSLTIYRGDSLTVRCLSLENMQKYGALGYSWTKNGALFQSDSSTEMWEDLYPDGSILKIKNIQKSVEYTCVVSNSVGTGSSSVYITVIDHGKIELCPENEAYGIKWLASAPGPTILSDCPGETSGKVARVCEKRDTNKSEWLIPDFSQCISNRLHSIYNEFRGLTFGYQKTNCSTILYSCLEYTMNRQYDFLPGEGGFLLQLLYEIFEYMKATGIQNELEVAANIILKICDTIMGNLLSINNQQQIKQIQDLIQQSMVYHNPQVIQPTTNSPKSLSSTQNHNLNSFRVFSMHVKTLPFNLQMNANQMFLDQLYMEIRSTKSLNEIISNGTFVITAISYRNLSNFLPRIYFTRNSLNEDVDYILASRIISTWLFNTNQTLNESIRPFYLPLDTAHIEIIFPHEHRPNNQWKPMCGYDSKATFEPTWRTDLCITENLVENITRCVCPFSGTFVILLTKKNFNTTTPHIASRPIFLIISCGCCFIQSCIAFTILIPVLYTNKCCVTFLKMQFCTATSTTMAIFILEFFKSLPKEWHNFISSSLTTLLLLGSSTLIAMTLVVQSELGARRKSQKAKIAYTIRGAIGLSWLFPVLCALCAPLVHNIVEYASMNWWLEYGTFGFVLFLIIEILFVILFCLLFITLIKKLLYLAKKHDKYNASILRRIGLLYRIAVILFFKIATDIFYLVNMNTNEFIINCIFGLCNILLGFSILFCFVLKSEIKLQLHMSSAARGKDGGGGAKKHLDDNFCSESINSPLSFFTNQEIEKVNESGPPTKVPLTVIPTPSHHQTIERLPTGTVETFLVSIPTNSTGHHDMNLVKSIDTYNVITYTPSHQAASQQIHCIYPDNYNPIGGKLGGETNEFVGVGGLDILQGVGQDSIIGIRPNTIDTPMLLKQQCPAPHLISLPVLQSTVSLTATTTTSTVTIQSIKLPEPVISSSQPPAPPIITITSTDDEDAIDGMLDRISHDLDYLLNRTTEVPVRRSTTQTQNSSGSNNFSHNSNNNNNNNNNNDSLSSTSLQTQVQIVNTTHVTGHISSNLSVHEVIIEESEE